MTRHPIIFDAHETPIAEGDRVETDDYGPGQVVGFAEPDESHWGLIVKTESGEVTIRGDIRDYAREGPDVEGCNLRCDDVEKVTHEVAWQYLSFANDDGFLGGCYLKAPGGTPLWAVMKAHALGINPGGEVMHVEVPHDVEIPAEFAERLLIREELEGFDVVMGA